MRLVTGPLITGPLVTALLVTALLAATGCSPVTPVVISTPAAASPIAPAAPTPTSGAATRVPSPTVSANSCDPVAAGDCLLGGHFLFQSPVTGVRPDPNYLYGTTQGGERDAHHGVEFPAPSGTPVLAAADGLVVFAGEGGPSQRYGPPLWSDRGYYGNLVLLQHEFSEVAGPVFTLYAHLSEVSAIAGATVQAGEPIGKIGYTGAADGPHLHFEVRQGGDTYADNRNPVLWLRPVEGAAVLAVRVQDRNGNPLYLNGELQLLQPAANGECTVDLALAVDSVKYQVQAYDRRKDGHYPVGRDPEWQETAALGDLPPGCYRLTDFGSGRRQAVRLEPGLLTLAIFQVE